MAAPTISADVTASVQTPRPGLEPRRLTERQRRDLVRQLNVSRRSVIDRWYRTQFDPDRLRRFGISGVSHLTAQLTVRSYVAPLFSLLLSFIETGAERFRDIYVDERLRYAPHLSEPEVRLEYFREVLPADEEALFGELSLDNELTESLAAILRQVHGPLLETPNRKNTLRLLALGDCLMGDLRSFLTLRARAAGITLDMRTLYFSASAEQSLAPASIIRYLQEHQTDVIALSFLTYRGLPLYTALLRAADRGDQAECNGRMAALLSAMHRCLDDIRAITDAPFLVHNASGLPLTRIRESLPLLPAVSGRRQRTLLQLNQRIAELVAHTPNALLIDEVGIVREHGLRACAAPALPRQITRDAFLHTSEIGSHLAREYEDILRSFATLRRAKVLLVDFDNTLWKGVMADGPVEHLVERQNLLRRLKDSGMLLVALSKNDPMNIRWSEMALAPSDFVLHKITWGLKVQSAEQAARELDLGLDSFVLIDDNPVELDLMQSQLPKVQVLDANDDFTWRSLERLLAFPNTRDTEEARARTQLYRAQALRREELAKGFDYASMMHGLRLQANLGRAKPADLPRLAELQQRTNQFNTTTLRYGREQLGALMQRDDYRVYAVSLRDKFGDVGLVACAIVRDAPAERVIESFVMSCRAMGFELERLLLTKILEAEATNLPVVGRFVPTDRNAPAMNLFPENGFVPRSETEWVLQPGAVRPTAPAWFTIRDRS